MVNTQFGILKRLARLTHMPGMPHRSPSASEEREGGGGTRATDSTSYPGSWHFRLIRRRLTNGSSTSCSERLSMANGTSSSEYTTSCCIASCTGSSSHGTIPVPPSLADGARLMLTKLAIPKYKRPQDAHEAEMPACEPWCKHGKRDRNICGVRRK